MYSLQTCRDVFRRLVYIRITMDMNRDHIHLVGGECSHHCTIFAPEVEIS